MIVWQGSPHHMTLIRKRPTRTSLSQKINPAKQKTASEISETVLIYFGGAKRARTADLYTASVALSQLSYSP